jgi:hypothetical protein
VITVEAVLDMFTGDTGKRGNINENLYVTVTSTIQPGLFRGLLPTAGHVLLPA